MTSAVWDEDKKGMRWLAGHVLAVIPMLIIAYPFLIWPILYGQASDGDLYKDISAATPQGSGNDALNRYYYPAIMLVTLALIVLQGVRPSGAIWHRSMVILTLLFGVFFLSVLWSDFPSITIKRALLQCLLHYPVILACMATDRPQNILRYLYVFHCFLMIINLVAVVVLPAGPIGHEGIYPQKNYLGQCATVAGLFILYEIVSKRGFQQLFAVCMLAITIIILIESRSKTSLGMFALAPVVGLLLTMAAYHLRMAAGFVSAVGAIAIFFIFWLGESADIWSFGLIAEIFFGDPTLTSRTDIWSFTNEMIARRPLFGYGFGAFWSTGGDGASFREAPGFIKKLNHGHNGYIDILLQVGVVGSTLFLVYLIIVGNALGKMVSRDFGLSWFCLTCFVYALGQNFLETTWFFGFEGMSALMITVLTLSVRLSQSPAHIRA